VLWDPGAGGARKKNGRFMVSNRLYTRIRAQRDPQDLLVQPLADALAAEARVQVAP